jgi:hypothetical protein
MTNKNVIEIISRLMDTNAHKVVYNASEVFTAVAHGYYYIRPGKKMFKFIEKISKIIDKSCKQWFKTNDDAAEAWGKTVADVLHVARSMFDAEYYASQVARMVMYEKYDESLLERYLYWLDEEELKSVFEGLLSFKRDFDIFISDLNLDRMMDELKERSLVVIENSPWYMKDYEERVDYIDNNWDFCFEYLTRETIIDIICRYANEDPVMLASMVKTFKYSDVRTAAELTGLAVYIEEAYGLDIFNPTITDIDKIDVKRATAFYRNRSGNFMTAQVNVIH